MREPLTRVLHARGKGNERVMNLNERSPACFFPLEVFVLDLVVIRL
jgi:hypothetical protein